MRRTVNQAILPRYLNIAHEDVLCLKDIFTHNNLILCVIVISTSTIISDLLINDNHHYK